MEEVASRGSEEEIHPRTEGGDLRGFSSPHDQGSTVKIPKPLVFTQQEPIEIPSEYWKVFMAPATSSIEFPIGDIMGDAPMKPIPLTILPNFHGISMEDPKTFLF